MRTRTIQLSKVFGPMVTTIMVITSCSADNNQQISTAAEQNKTTTTLIDWSKDQPLGDVAIALVDSSTRLPGPFVGPFDGTIETLGHCVEHEYADTEEVEWVPYDHDFGGVEAWREVVSIDISGAVLEPDGFSTAEAAGVTIELVSIGHLDTRYAYPEHQWAYEGETLLALASELDRGRTVQVSSENNGSVTGISIDDQGYVRFIGNCQLRRSERLQTLSEDLSGVRGTTVTAHDLLVETQKTGSGKPVLVASEEAYPETDPPTWLELDPMDRQIDLTETPQEVLDRLVNFQVHVSVPELWTTEAHILCPRQDLGWARLCSAGGAAVDGVLVFEMLVEAGKPVELWLMNPSGLDPRGPLAVIDGDEVMEGQVVKWAVETSLSMPDVHKDPAATKLTVEVLSK